MDCMLKIGDKDMNDILTRIVLGGDNKTLLKSMKNRLGRMYNETDNPTVKMNAGYYYSLIDKYLKSKDINIYLRLIKECLCDIQVK